MCLSSVSSSSSFWCFLDTLANFLNGIFSVSGERRHRDFHNEKEAIAFWMILCTLGQGPSLRREPPADGNTPSWNFLDRQMASDWRKLIRGEVTCLFWETREPWLRRSAFPIISQLLSHLSVPAGSSLAQHFACAPLQVTHGYRVGL